MTGDDDGVSVPEVAEPGTEPGAAPGAEPGAGPGQRIDKWLFHARFFKTRSLAGRMAAAGKIRVDGRIVGKAHFAVRPGHVLTFVQGRHVRVVRVVSLPERRGPAGEAQACYEDLQPPSPETALPRDDGPSGLRRATDGAPAARAPGAGRPTKRDRRRIDWLRGE